MLDRHTATRVEDIKRHPLDKYNQSSNKTLFH